MTAYASAADQLTYYTYLIRYPEYYLPMSKTYFEEIEYLGSPIYNPMDPEAFATGRLPATQLCVMYAHDVPFHFTDDYDIPHILYHCDAYFHEIEQKEVYDIPVFREFLEKLIPFRDMIKERYLRLMNGRRPDWKEIYYGCSLEELNSKCLGKAFFGSILPVVMENEQRLAYIKERLYGKKKTADSTEYKGNCDFNLAQNFYPDPLTDIKKDDQPISSDQLVCLLKRL